MCRAAGFSKISIFKLLFALSSSAYAGIGINCYGPIIKATLPPYNSIPAIQGVGTADIAEVRIAALTQAAGAYRTLYGISSWRIV